LIGAVALTLVAIILLPLLLENEPPPAGRLEVHMPPVASLPQPIEPKQVERKQIEPKQVELAPAPQPVNVPTVAEPIAPPAHKPALPDKPKPKPKVLAEPEAKPKPKPNAPVKSESKKPFADKPLPTAFVVQLGAFSDPTKTAALKSRAADLGLATYIDKSGTLTRLRVGPFSSHAAAEEAAAQLDEAGMHGQVMAK
jgi:DedD protein